MLLLLQSSPPRDTFRALEVIITQSTEGHDCFIIDSGDVKRYTAGDFFGEQALLRKSLAQSRLWLPRRCGS